METLELIKSLLPGIVGIIIAYLVYNHKRHDKSERDIAILQTQMDDVKKDIREIKEGVNYLVHRSDERLK